MRWDSIYLVIRWHYARDARFGNRRLEAGQEYLAQDPFRIICGSYVRAGFRLPMRRIVLGGGHHVLGVDSRAVALNRFHARNAKARHQVWVFAIGLFDSAPPGVSTQIEVGAEHMLASPNAGFQSRRGEYAGDQIG